MPIPKKKQNKRKGRRGFCNQPPYKERFRTELDAKMALALWAGAKGAARFYGPCEFCAGWHTTGQTRRKE